MKKLSVLIFCIVINVFVCIPVIVSAQSGPASVDLSDAEVIYEENFDSMEQSQLEEEFLFEKNNNGSTISLEEYADMGNVMVVRDKIFSGSGDLYSQVLIKDEAFIENIQRKFKNVLVLEADVMYRANTANVTNCLLSGTRNSYNGQVPYRHGLYKYKNEMGARYGVWSGEFDKFSVNDDIWYSVKTYYKFDKVNNDVYVGVSCVEKGSDSEPTVTSWNKIKYFTFTDGQFSEIALLYTWIAKGQGTIGSSSEVYLDNIKISLDADNTVDGVEIKTNDVSTNISGNITGKVESQNIHIEIRYDFNGEIEYSADIPVDDEGNFKLEFDNTNKRNGKYTITITGDLLTYTADYTINSYDEIKPVLKLRGADVILYEGEAYEEYGADVEDDKDTVYELLKNIKITGSENISVPGSYEVIYTVTDKAGNQSEPVIRNVEVLSGARPDGSYDEKSIIETINSSENIELVLTDNIADMADITGLYREVTCLDILVGYIEDMRPYSDFEEFKRKFSSKVSLVYDNELMLMHDYINSNDIASVKIVLEQSELLDLANNINYKALNDKDTLFEFVLEQNYSSPRELIDGVTDAINLYYRRQMAVAEFNSADIKGVGALLEKYASALDINLNEDYACLKNKDELYKQLLANGYESYEEIKKVYDENLGKLIYEQRLIDSINDATYSEIKMLVEANEDIFDISFDNISSYRLKKILSALTKIEFTDAKHFVSEYDRELREADDGGYGNSGGVGGGGGRYTPVATVPEIFQQSDIPDNSAPESNADKKQSFADVSSDHWASAYIEYFYDKGIVAGSGDGLFYPESNITRAEFVKMAVVAFGFENNTATCIFDDVKETDWSYRYIAAANENGFINGISETKFDTGGYITRQDMAVILFRIANKLNIDLSGNEVSFTDGNMISDYADLAVHALADNGVINGFANGEFRAFDNATRAQAVKMMSVLLDRI